MKHHGERDFQASCQSKRGYRSFAAGERAIARWKRLRGLDHAMSPYLCQFCGRFHLGTAKKETRRRPPEQSVVEDFSTEP